MISKKENYPLFSEYDLEKIFNVRLKGIQEEVANLPRDQFLATSEETLHNHFFSKSSIEPLVLYEDRQTMKDDETQVDVSEDSSRGGYHFGNTGPLMIPGIRVTISVPWSGMGDLFRSKPSQYSSAIPRGNIKSPGSDGIGYLEIIIEQPTDIDGGEIRKTHENNLNLIKQSIKLQTPLVEQHNKTLSDAIHGAIKKRKNDLLIHEKLPDILGIPLQHRENPPVIKPIPLERRTIKPLPNVPKEGYPPEPGIPTEEYEFILDIIRHLGSSFEATPSTFAVHDEEDLRDFILANLNVHYKGSASGETFRVSGKTDIKIEQENRAAFIAECKVWRGQNELEDGINQLLGYLTWRDCKTSFIIFNKNNAKFSELQSKVPEVFNQHKSFIKQLKTEQNGEWRFLLSLNEDEGREISIHVFLFNLFFQK